MISAQGKVYLKSEARAQVLLSLSKAMGRISTHAKCIRRSNRKRGREARTQIKSTKIKEIEIVKLNNPLQLKKKNVVKITAIKIKNPYSAIKNRANGEAPYSVLNPETSSDSPSLKSKGGRLVSAKEETNQITPTTGKARIRGKGEGCTKCEKE